jgi:hypothetical protein
MLFFIPEYFGSQNFRVQRYKKSSIWALLNFAGNLSRALAKLQIRILL